MSSDFILLSSAAWLAFLHAMAPDHWLPFVALAKASRWSRKRLAGISFLAALGHVTTSLVIGLIGVILGRGLVETQGFEGHRGSIATLLLIGFGVAYMAWGIKHARHGVHHRHLGVDTLSEAAQMAFTRRAWTLFAIIIFGPCEPLIPLIFLSWAKGIPLLLSVIVLFSTVTIAMVVAQSMLAFQGIGLMGKKHENFFIEHGHTVAGATIVMLGLMVVFLGI